jgi:Holliday junction resolvase
MQRDKGADFEREVVNRIKEFGFRAKRNLTQVRDGGHDIDTDCLGKIECKRRRKLAQYLTPQPGVAMVVARSDRGRRMVILDLDDFLATAQMAKSLGREWSQRVREAQAVPITATEIMERREEMRSRPPSLSHLTAEWLEAARKDLGLSGREFDRVFEDDCPQGLHYDGDGCPGDEPPKGARRPRRRQGKP